MDSLTLTLTLSFLIGDEASFVMNGEVNAQNVRQYAPKGHPPTFNYKNEQFSSTPDGLGSTLWQRFDLWASFLEMNVNGIAYLRMLNEFVFPQLAENFTNQYREGVFRGIWWAQDGAPAHHLIEVRDRFNYVFGNNCIIGLGYDVEWPPRSLNLTPCDFLFVGIYER